MLTVRGLPPGLSLGLLFPEKIVDKLALKGLKKANLTDAQIRAYREFSRGVAPDSKAFYALTEPRVGAEISNVPTVKEGFPLRFVLQAGKGARPGTFDVIQSAAHTVLGGNTFVVRIGKPGR